MNIKSLARPWIFSAAYLVCLVMILVIALIVISINVVVSGGQAQSVSQVLMNATDIITLVLFVVACCCLTASAISVFVYVVRRRYSASAVCAVSTILSIVLTALALPIAGPLLMASGLMLEEKSVGQFQSESQLNAPHRMEFAYEEFVDGKITYETNVFENGKVVKPMQ